MIVITGTNKRCIRISITAELVAGVFMERFCNAGLFPLALPCLRNSRTDWELAQLSLRVSEELRVWQSTGKASGAQGKQGQVLEFQTSACSRCRRGKEVESLVVGATLD